MVRSAAFRSTPPSSHAPQHMEQSHASLLHNPLQPRSRNEASTATLEERTHWRHTLTPNRMERTPTTLLHPSASSNTAGTNPCPSAQRYHTRGTNPMSTEALSLSKPSTRWPHCPTRGTNPKPPTPERTHAHAHRPTEIEERTQSPLYRPSQRHEPMHFTSHFHPVLTGGPHRRTHGTNPIANVSSTYPNIRNEPIHRTYPHAPEQRNEPNAQRPFNPICKSPIRF